MGRENRSTLNYLAIDLPVSPSPQNQALNALVFLYERVIKRPLDNGINAEPAPEWQSKRLSLLLIV